MAANPTEFDSALQLFASPDGLHWKHALTNVIAYDSSKKPHHLDSQNVIFWDDRLQKYVAYFRKNMNEPGSQGRTVARGESPDLNHFPRVEDSPVVMRADPEQLVHYDSPKKERVALLDTYTNGSLKYPWAQDAYLMFPTEYYHYGGQVAEFRKEAPVNAGAVDTCFASSRDGVKWQRYDHRPWVGLGMKGEFDSKRIYMVYGVLPALNDRELYMYYLGTSETHGWQRNDQNNRLLTAAGVAPTGSERHQPGGAAAGRVCVRARGVHWRRVHHAAAALCRGAAFVERGHLGLRRVARGDCSMNKGSRFPNYTLADCDLVHTANEISRVVKWKGESFVKGLAGQSGALAFRDAGFGPLRVSVRRSGRRLSARRAPSLAGPLPMNDGEKIKRRAFLSSVATGGLALSVPGIEANAAQAASQGSAAEGQNAQGGRNRQPPRPRPIG